MRVTSIDFGRPSHAARPDEELVLAPALELMDGASHVHYFRYPSGLMVLQAIWLKGLDRIGWLPPGGLVAYADDPLPFHVAARHLSALMGTLTVLLAFLLARKLAGDAAGLLAAAALAVMPAHQLHSHFATLESPGAFFMMLSAYLAMKIRDESEDGPWLFASAFAAGIATAIKYPFGAALLVPFGLAITRRNGVRRSLAMVIVAGLGFLLAAPTFVFDLGDALGGIRTEADSQGRVQRTTGVMGAARQHLEWIWYGVGPITVAWAALGLGAAALRRRRSLWLLLPFLALFLLHVGTGKLVGRYLVPMAPLIAVFAGCAAPLLRWRRLLVIGVAVTLVVPGIWQSSHMLQVMGAADTRGELVEAFDDGRLPRDLPILVPLYPFQSFPPAWNAGYFEFLLSADNAGILCACGSEKELAHELFGNDDQEPARPKCYQFQRPSWKLLRDRFEGQEVLMIFPSGFAPRYHRWHSQRLREELEREEPGQWHFETLLVIDPNDGGSFPSLEIYDELDYWFVPFKETDRTSRPGPRYEICRVRIP